MRKGSLVIVFVVALVGIFGCRAPVSVEDYATTGPTEGDIRTGSDDRKNRISGELQVLVLNYQDRAEYRFLLETDERSIPVEGTLKPQWEGHDITAVTSIESGQDLSQVKEPLSLSNVSVSESPTDLSRAALERRESTGVDENLVVPVYFNDMQAPDISAPALTGIYEGANQSVSDYLRWASSGEYTINATVSDPVQLPTARPDDDSEYDCSEMKNDALRRVEKEVGMQRYDVISVHFPDVQGCPMGLAGNYRKELNGNSYDKEWTSHWHHGDMERITATAIHEHGHTLGLKHMWSLLCEERSLLYPGDACGTARYGGKIDVMGGIQFGGVFNVNSLQQLSWPVNDVQKIEEQGVYTVQGFTSESSPQALTIDRNKSTKYYIVHRGPDDFYFDQYDTSGVYVFYARSNISLGSNYPTEYLIAPPSDSAGENALEENESLSEFEQPFTLKAVNVTENFSKVKIKFTACGDGHCAAQESAGWCTQDCVQCSKRLKQGIDNKFGAECGDELYDATYDLNEDKVINQFDIFPLGDNWGNVTWCEKRLQDPPRVCSTNCSERLKNGIEERWGSECGDSSYNETFDLNEDGKIDTEDTFIVGDNWGDIPWCKQRFQNPPKICS